MKRTLPSYWKGAYVQILFEGIKWKKCLDSIKSEPIPFVLKKKKKIEYTI